MIKLTDLALQRGAKILLEQANLTIYPGHNWGLIGANGSGKSSLFKLIVGQLQPDAGEFDLPSNWQVAHMAQEVPHTNRSAVEYVLDGDAELRAVEAAIEAAGDNGERLADGYAKLEAIDGYTAKARAEQLLHGLGFTGEDLLKPAQDFSGGWRIRLNLAQALMCRSDLLLLDEPTNHLDLDATLWLEQWLKRYPGTLVIISHDRDFLDNVVSNIANIEGGSIQSYSGNYSSYERQKAERLSAQAAAYEKQQARVAEIEDFVRRFRAKATKAKQAQSRLKELERMEKIAPAHIDSPFSFAFPEPDKMSDTLMSLSLADIGYGDKKIVEGINLTIHSDSRIGLLGHNGAGKSTLMKTLSKTLAPLAGELVDGMHLKIGYFAQHQLEALDLDASAALHLQRLDEKASEQSIRNFLGSFGFQGDRAFEVITHFSGGEKARLALAIVAWQRPNLLLLDEPTNHLDLEVRHALTVALQAFSGAIVVVSHDRHLLRNTVEQFLLVDEGAAEPYDGDLEDYQSWLLDISNKDKSFDDSDSSKPSSSDAASIPKQVVDKKEQRQAAAALREKLRPLSQALKKIEKKMENLQARGSEIEERLASPDMYSGENAELPKLLKEQGKINQSLSEFEEEWLELSEELEEASSKLS